MLERKSFRLLNPVVVDLIQIHFLRGIVHIVFMRGVAGPVPTGSVDLDRDQFICRKVRADDIDDLPGSVSAATQTADDINRRD